MRVDGDPFKFICFRFSSKLKSFISKLLNNLEPDFSTLSPIVVTEVRNLREHEESYAQKDANEKSVSIELAKFTPKTFSEQDLKRIYSR
mgnify:CR=1 FL=1